MNLLTKICKLFANKDDVVGTYVENYLHGKVMVSDLYVKKCNPNKDFFKDILDNIYYIKTRYYFGIQEDNELAKEAEYKFKTAMTSLENEDFCSFVLEEICQISNFLGMDFKENVYLLKDRDFLINKFNNLFSGLLENFIYFYKASGVEDTSEIVKILKNINLYQFTDSSVKYPLASIIYLSQKNHLISDKFSEHELLASSNFDYEDKLYEQIEDIYLDALHRAEDEKKKKEKHDVFKYLKKDCEKVIEDTKENEPIIHFFDHFSSPGLTTNGNEKEYFSVTKHSEIKASDLAKNTLEMIDKLEQKLKNNGYDVNKAKPNKDPNALVTPANPLVPSDNTRLGKEGKYVSPASKQEDQDQPKSLDSIFAGNINHIDLNDMVEKNNVVVSESLPNGKTLNISLDEDDPHPEKTIKDIKNCYLEITKRDPRHGNK